MALSPSVAHAALPVDGAVSVGRHSAAPRLSWERRHARALAITDTAVVLGTVYGLQSVRDQLESGRIALLDHTLISVVIVVCWLFALKFYGSRDRAVIGDAGMEFRRILNATLRVFGLFAIWSLVANTGVGRGYMLVALPVGAALLVASRAGWRVWVRRQRAAGHYIHPVVLVGSPSTVLPVARELRRNPDAGYEVRAISTTGDIQDLASPDDIHVERGLDDVVGLMSRVGADTVVVTGSDELPEEKLRDLSWRLEDERYNLVVAPGLVDVGAPRVNVRPINGLPLLYVDSWRHERSRIVAKRAFDAVVSSLLIAALAVPMLLVALLIKLTSAGPVFYRQERIGLDGKRFGMIKFRTMRVGADAELAALLAAQNHDQPLFKVVDDPRITSVGRVLRKYSIDELPQLFNVFTGDMSLVGPRPQVAGEVALYDEAAHRRHIVKPGMTGLWQVSGRSSLDWHDAIRLDLYYVENWSMTTDIMILFRTFRAVIAPGADAH